MVVSTLLSDIAILIRREVALYMFANANLSSFSTFLPIILRTLHYSALNTQIMTIPIYICAAIATVILAIASDRLRLRGVFVAGSFATAGVGWLMLLIDKSYKVSLAGTFLIGMGTYPCIVLLLSWANSNCVGFTKRYSNTAITVLKESMLIGHLQGRCLGYH
jgi:hypothetical protein